jgi:hypothetical protein
MTRQRRNPIDDSQEPSDLFRSIRSKLAQRESVETGDGISVDVFPITAEPLPEPRPPEPRDSAGTPFGIGEILCGRYVIESQLANGIMGTVYKALDQSRSEHTEADAYVAIKVLHEKTRSRSDVLTKLRREFYCAQALSHRSIIKVYELDLHQFPFFSMEWIDGENLSSLMRRSHPVPLPRTQAWAVIREVGEGLAHAHQRRVIHGDIKPQHVMVTNSGEVRILDFGASGGSAAALSPAYASCELLEGREADARDDLFALACLSYELLAGAHPFQQRRATEARAQKIAPPRPPGLTGRQWRALMQGLAWERAARPRSVPDWLAELELGGAPSGPIPSPGKPKTSLLAKGGVKPALIALLTAVVVGAIAWAVLSRLTEPTIAADPGVAEVEIAPAAIPAPRGADEARPPADARVPKADLKAPSVAARPIDRTERIGMAVSSYSFGPGQRFAEIRVHRSTGSKGATSFEWWTEPATALAGTDFAPQAPATVFFPSGMRTVSLFVKLLPNASRQRTALFYVVLGNTSGGSTLSNPSKASISLHP